MAVASKHSYLRRAVLLVALVVAVPALAQEADEPVRKGVKVVKSLFGHRRQDVREAAERQERERQMQQMEALPRYMKQQESVRPAEMIRILEKMLNIRMLPGSHYEAGTRMLTALRALRDRAAEQDAPFSIVWDEGDRKWPDEELNEVLLQDDIELSGCNLAEALQRICQSADCQYTLRGNQVVMKSVADSPQTLVIPCGVSEFEKCFNFKSELRTPEGKAIRSSRIDLSGDRRRFYVITGKRYGQQLTRRIAGEYNQFRGTLTLTGMPDAILQCRRDLDELYHETLKSGRGRDSRLEDPNDKRYKLEYKLNSIPVFPIEFPAGVKMNDVVRYLSLLIRHSRAKLPVKFSAQNGSLTCKVPLVIRDCSALEALMKAVDSFGKSYTIQGNRITLSETEGEYHTYAVRNTFIDLLKEQQRRGNIASRNGSRTQQSADADLIYDTLKIMGIELSDPLGASYREHDFSLRVRGSTQNHYLLNRHYSFFTRSKPL